MILFVSIQIDPLGMLIPGIADWDHPIGHAQAIHAVNNKLKEMLETRKEVESICFFTTPGWFKWQLKWKLPGEEEQTLRVGEKHTFANIRKMLPDTVLTIIRALSTCKVEVK